MTPEELQGIVNYAEILMGIGILLLLLIKYLMPDEPEGPKEIHWPWPLEDKKDANDSDVSDRNGDSDSKY